YLGSCDASAAVAIDTNLVVVASDEDSRLRVYHRDLGGLPVQTFDVSDYLGLERHSPQTDIEGGTRVGDRVYWITSHSRNPDGKFRSNRYRFFSTRFQVKNGKVEINFVGDAYRNLVADLASAPQLKQFDFSKASSLPPKSPGGLNIEGLCATPEGHLLIGFRNPVPNGRALLVPLENPDEVIAGKAAKFGEPILLRLDGLGVRDMAYQNGRYLIIA